MRVLSWNVQWGRGADGVVDLARLIDAVRTAGELDVICLQEVACGLQGLPGGRGEDMVAVLAQAFPQHQPVFGPALDLPAAGGRRAAFGNLLLSRLPLGQIRRHLLPAPADGSARSMQRACLEVVVEARDGPLRILTTHLEYHSALQRRAQIAALRALQEEARAQAALLPPPSSSPAFAPRPRPARALLCGDLNCEPGSEDYRLLLARPAPQAALWLDAWRLCHPGRRHAATVGLHGAEWPGRAFCCDYFLLSEELRPAARSLRVLEETAASDHQPLLLELDC